MNMQHKKGIFEEKCEEYWKAGKKRKSVILSSLVEVTGLRRKTCIKRLRRMQLRDPAHGESRGRPRYYTPHVIAALLEVWEIGSEACGENLHPLINEYIDIQIREKEWKHDDLVTGKLRKMSMGSVKYYVGGFTRTRRNFGGQRHHGEEPCDLNGANSYGRLGQSRGRRHASRYRGALRRYRGRRLCNYDKRR